MIKAGDTVMKRPELERLARRLAVSKPLAEVVAKAQAERTEAMLKDQWKQAGIREVVEWLIKQEHRRNFDSDIEITISSRMWKAQLKEWEMEL